jgi:hypothetical protein
MSRPIRFLLKKRGDRRTGSSIVGNWITLILAVLLVLLGVFVLWMLMIGTIWPEWHAQRDYVQGSATIVDKQLASDPTDARRYRMDVTIAFAVEQQTYRVTTYDIHRQFTPGPESQQQLLDELKIGQVVDCWYDPDDPAQVVIRRGMTWWIWPMLLVPLGLLLSGGVLLTRTLLYWNLSPERLAKQLGQQSERLFQASGQADGEILPNVPRDDNIINSPGTTLRYRLPIEISQWWYMLGMIAAALFWNGIVLTVLATSIHQAWQGNPPWLQFLTILPFAGLGGYLVTMVFRYAKVSFGISPTVVEISEHPLSAGQDCLVAISQSGIMQIRRLVVLLVCEESATFHQGTDSRTEIHRVVEEVCHIEEDLTVDEQQPFATQFLITIPETAMHSFQSANHEISWKLIVRMAVADRPLLERIYSLIIRPTPVKK